jgi:hypothetical protein
MIKKQTFWNVAYVLGAIALVRSTPVSRVVTA